MTLTLTPNCYLEALSIAGIVVDKNDEIDSVPRSATLMGCCRDARPCVSDLPFGTAIVPMVIQSQSRVKTCLVSTTCRLFKVLFNPWLSVWGFQRYAKV